MAVSSPVPTIGHPAAEFSRSILSKLTYACGKVPKTACDHDWYMATALAIRDRVIDHWVDPQRDAEAEDGKLVYYLSVEFLIGRLLFDTLTNLRMVDTARSALSSLGVDLDHLRMLETDAALGNGGLGRLAACFMDSMSTLGIAAYGYGIRYDHGLFRQKLRDGAQQEVPDDWLSLGNPWEFKRPDVEFSVCFGGTVEYVASHPQTAKALWYPAERVLAVAYDTPVTGWRGRRVNPLRLWSARATTPLWLAAFNQGDYVGASAASAQAEAISRVLYPSDATLSGQELRLRQEYFFTSASLQDIVQRHMQRFGDLKDLHKHASIQLNDTHPAIAVAELMRVLVDEHDVDWEEAWAITQATLSYTNHTLLPEALETWSVELFGRLLPRHLQIIYLINWLHLRTASQTIRDPEVIAAISIIEEGVDKRIRMGQLAFIGSHKTNGVSALHTNLLRETLFRDLDALYPDRIVNKTNGITFRRWLYEANPGLTTLLTRTIGEKVLDDPSELKKLERHADNTGFITRFAAARAHNKVSLLRRINELTGVTVDPESLFDVQIKRIHEYKRQLLNIIETIARYNAIRAEPGRNWVPRVKIFAGKAAPSYERAKLIIRLINDVARIVNRDASIRGALKVVFVPNYSVSLAEEIVSAADLSEQISTAGMEASGTGNMKLALNGALTIGTLDGANVEISQHVGADNAFIFGLKTYEVDDLRRAGVEGAEFVAANPLLAGALDSIANGTFSSSEPSRYGSLVDAVRGYDPFMVAADFEAYWNTQQAVDALWMEPALWWQKSILNTARMAWFSSDRAIREYATDIWGVNVD
jgi:glycogen phosphorylase